MLNEPPQLPTAPSAGERPDRLDSWKEVAAHLQRDVTTAQRWERREGMPVHRHRHDRLGTVYAFRSELDAWWRGRSSGPARRQAPDGRAATQVRDRKSVV